jgi:hypothetical protein
MNAAAQAADAKLQHPRAIAKGDTGISRHQGLAHSMSDMGPLTEVARAELAKSVLEFREETGVLTEKLEKVIYLLKWVRVEEFVESI